eukprot:3531676-Rhodomonas_salina.2
MTLQDFKEHETAKIAKLSEFNVFALRAYTSGSFPRFNKPLRSGSPHAVSAVLACMNGVSAVAYAARAAINGVCAANNAARAAIYGISAAIVGPHSDMRGASDKASPRTRSR